MTTEDYTMNNSMPTPDDDLNALPVDALVTAHALGELDDPALIRRAEAAMADDAALQDSFARTRMLADALTDELAAEDGPMLAETHRLAIERGEHVVGERSDGVVRTPASIWLLRWGGLGALAAAACLLVMVNLPGQVGESGMSEDFAANAPVDRKAGLDPVSEVGAPPEGVMVLKTESGSVTLPRPGRGLAGDGIASGNEAAPRGRRGGEINLPWGRQSQGRAPATRGASTAAPPPSAPQSSVAADDVAWHSYRMSDGEGAVAGHVNRGGSLGRDSEVAFVAAPEVDLERALEESKQQASTAVPSRLREASPRGRGVQGVLEYPQDWPDLSTRETVTIMGEMDAQFHYVDDAVGDAQDIAGMTIEQVQGRLSHVAAARARARHDLSDEQRAALDEEFQGLMKRLREHRVNPQRTRRVQPTVTDNPFILTTTEARSTFAVDVDTASYSRIRDSINRGQVPSPPMVRIEEMLNYFDYGLTPPATDSDVPFAAHLEMNPAPWNVDHRLVMIGLKGREVDADLRPATSLVFLIDVSGSMKGSNRLPLLKQSLSMLVKRLTGDDRIAIVTFNSDARLVLQSTYVRERQTILDAINALSPGGSTNGGAGLDLAYEQASTYLIDGGINRVILATDGDFNVGVTEDSDLVRLIEAKRESGVFLNALGFGRGNFKDDKLEQLSNRGNGTFAFIDTPAEAKKTLVDDLSGTLVTIAKDVKTQVEFNPSQVEAYRLIGYENRVLANRQFRDDAVDAGEIGAGHEVIALYEVKPRKADEPLMLAADEEMAFQRTEMIESDDLLQVNLRWKAPDGDVASEINVRLGDADDATGASEAFTLASAIAATGMILRESEHKGSADLDMALDLARRAAASSLVEAERLAENLVHYTEVARPELASAHAKALFEMELSDAQFGAVFSALGADRIKSAAARGMGNADMAPVWNRVNGRLAEISDDDVARFAAELRGVGTRQAFVDLLEKLRALYPSE